MNSGIREFIIIGSSRGLGAALVQELLMRTSCRVFGISRTPLDELPNGPRWTATGRYQHLAVDIGADGAAERMAELARSGKGRMCVVYNAAHIEKDFLAEGTIELGAFDRVNAAGIAGLRNVLAAFEAGLLQRGGVFAGVSSFWGRVTPVSLRYVAYPATKAYLDSILRSLRSLWPRQVQVTAITIGNIKEQAGRLPSWFIPTYVMAAKEIVGSLAAAQPPRCIDYPCWHAALYKCILRWMPGRVLSFLFGLYLKLESRAGVPPDGARNDQ